MIRVLRLMIKSKMFHLGDSHWIQLNITDIGTPPSPTYATVLYCVFELFILERSVSHLLLYIKFIDNVLVL